MPLHGKRTRVEDLIRISIKEVIYTGSWERKIGNTTIELVHTIDGIKLFVDRRLQPVCWKIYERTVKGKLQNGGYIPSDRGWYYYCFANNGRRYKHLYLLSLPDNRFRIGTRNDFGALYASSCRSKFQRTLYQEALLISLSKRKRERKIAWRNELRRRRRVPKNIVENAV
jgi:hypothetical protein